MSNLEPDDRSVKECLEKIQSILINCIFRHESKNTFFCKYIPLNKKKTMGNYIEIPKYAATNTHPGTILYFVALNKSSFHTYVPLFPEPDPHSEREDWFKELAASGRHQVSISLKDPLLARIPFPFPVIYAISPGILRDADSDSRKADSIETSIMYVMRTWKRRDDFIGEAQKKGMTFPEYNEYP